MVVHRLPEIEGRTALTFRELIEIRFVQHFLRAGVSWRNIRRAAAEAQGDLLSEPGPQLRFSTDEVTIFANSLVRNGDRIVRDLVANQYVMLLVLAQSIRTEFDLEAEDVIRAWHPRREAPLALIDPRRSFGHPIVESGVPTRAPADALRAELFGTSEEAFRQAGAFEMTLAARSWR